MKNLLKGFLTLSIIALSTNLFAGYTFSSEEAKCSLTFPTEYTEESSTDDGTKTITIQSIQGSMIFSLTVSIYSEPVAEDENDLTEAVTLLNVAEKLGAKVKTKNVLTFSVSNQKGFMSFIKPKIGKTKYQGNYYVLVRDNVMYQFTALAPKKEYNEREANRFSDSFSLK